MRGAPSGGIQDSWVTGLSSERNVVVLVVTYGCGLSRHVDADCDDVQVAQGWGPTVDIVLS